MIQVMRYTCISEDSIHIDVYVIKRHVEYIYRKTSNIRRSLVGNKIVDN